ncbi:MAG TPA: hypothetical protein VG275_07190 [Solirubrobacteraceae bacterium]|jgi:hypothetical protein|nr:hypothetical protein [Solirubrobacteraceae bacterium]
MGVTVEMADPQGQLLREVADRRLTRDDVALTYAFALRQASEVDFALVNHAILDRWSMAALRYIKEKAWRYVKEAEREDEPVKAAGRAWSDGSGPGPGAGDGEDEAEAPNRTDEEYR